MAFVTPARHLLKRLALLLAPSAGLSVLLVAVTFPFATDDPIRREDAQAAYYQMAYESTDTAESQLIASQYDEIATKARELYGVVPGVTAFVEHFQLQGAKVLDVGSGDGYLQDVVADYTGLDISRVVAPLYHKPFVAGTATAMPFADATFDVVWSIWVLEHIPNPEAALREIRRVVKPGGYLYLRPAFNVKPWAAEGHEARPYRDLSLTGKISKATIPIRSSLAWWFVSHVPARVIRSWGAEPSALHYRRLTPNYKEYWQADSDAVNDLDSVEVARWFESRGDTCLNCGAGIGRVLLLDRPLVIQRH